MSRSRRDSDELRSGPYIVLLDGDTGKAVVSRDVVFQRALEMEDSSAARLDSAPPAGNLPAVVPENAEVSIPIVDLGSRLECRLRGE